MAQLVLLFDVRFCSFVTETDAMHKLEFLGANRTFQAVRSKRWRPDAARAIACAMQQIRTKRKSLGKTTNESELLRSIISGHLPVCAFAPAPCQPWAPLQPALPGVTGPYRNPTEDSPCPH